MLHEVNLTTARNLSPLFDEAESIREIREGLAEEREAGTAGRKSGGGHEVISREVDGYSLSFRDRSWKIGTSSPLRRRPAGFPTGRLYIGGLPAT